jgi:hypothetical protein
MDSLYVVFTFLAILIALWFGRSSSNRRTYSKELTVFTPKREPFRGEKVIVVIVNPHSGSNKAPTIFENQVKQSLLDAQYTIHFFGTHQYCIFDRYLYHAETQHEGHATEIARSLNLNNLKAIVCISGDVSNRKIRICLLFRASSAKCSTVSPRIPTVTKLLKFPLESFLQVLATVLPPASVSRVSKKP